jgi:hypothetical protein
VCDTKSLNTSGFTDWRFGWCRKCNPGQVLDACPHPDVRCRLLGGGVRSSGGKPKRFLCHPGIAGEGKCRTGEQT